MGLSGGADLLRYRLPGAGGNANQVGPAEQPVGARAGRCRLARLLDLETPGPDD